MLCPLLSDDDVNADHDHPQSKYKSYPPERWANPRSKYLFGVKRCLPLIKPSDHLIVGDRQPARNVWLHHFYPFILWSGKPESVRYTRDHKL